MKVFQRKSLLYLLLTIVILLYGLIAAKTFLYPLSFGLLFAYLLFPLVNFLEKHHFHRILAILASIIIALLVITCTFLIFYSQLSKIFDDFEVLKDQANQNIELLQESIQNTLGIENIRIEEFFKKQINNILGNGEGSNLKFFSATAGTIFRFFILPVYVFLFLFYRTKFAYFILKIVDPQKKKITLNILRDISTIVAKYMGGVSIVVLILCIINSTGLYIVGVEYPILLGILSAFFNFIPYFGTLMGGSIPLFFVLLTTNDPLQNAIQVIILFVIIQFTENNILTPNIVGGNVRLNPFFVIVGLVAGGMIWGIPGMLVIVPVLAVLRIIFVHNDRMKPYAFLLGKGGTRKHAITRTKIKHFFNRIKNKIEKRIK